MNRPFKFEKPEEKMRPITEIYPDVDNRAVLMGVGPTPLHPKVAEALTITVDHLGGAMHHVVSDIRKAARYAFQTNACNVFGLAAPASGAMEAAIANMVRPGDHVLCLVNGVFSERMSLMATRCGGIVDKIDVRKGHDVTAEMVREHIAKATYDYRIMTVVQGETSTCVLMRELPEILQVAKEAHVFAIVDVVSTLGCTPVHMDEWQADIMFVGGQKGLGAPAGVSLMVIHTHAYREIMERAGQGLHHWVYDMVLAEHFWGPSGSYHYTAPVNGLAGLHEALRLLCEEGLEARFRRHDVCSRAMHTAFEEMGLRLVVNGPQRLLTTVGFWTPEGILGDRLRTRLKAQERLVISGAFGAPMCRVGCMGEQARPEMVLRAVEGIGRAVNAEAESEMLDIKHGTEAAELVLKELESPPAP